MTTYHVVKRADGSWSVHREGSRVPTAIARTEAEAERIAAERAADRDDAEPRS